VEPVTDVPYLCRKIRDAGMRVGKSSGETTLLSLGILSFILNIDYLFQVGLALKPGTDVSVISEYTELADLVLVMTVEPGFGGQKFMTNMMEKVKILRNLHPGLDIEVDGGVGLATVQDCAKVIRQNQEYGGTRSPGNLIVIDSMFASRKKN